MDVQIYCTSFQEYHHLVPTYLSINQYIEIYGYIDLLHHLLGASSSFPFIYPSINIYIYRYTDIQIDWSTFHQHHHLVPRAARKVVQYL